VEDGRRAPAIESAGSVFESGINHEDSEELRGEVYVGITSQSSDMVRSLATILSSWAFGPS